MSRFAGLLLLPLLLGSGCLQFRALLRLNPDGSGTIEQTVRLRADILEQMRAFMPSDGGGLFMEDKDDLRAAARQLGEGVRLRSVTQHADSVGQGYTAVYAFDDVRQVRLMLSPRSEGTAHAAATEAYTFAFTPGSPSHLTIQLPPPAATAHDAPPADVSDADLAQVRELFRGMQMSVAVEVPGTVRRTNALHAEGNRITLVDLSFDGLLAHPEVFRRMTTLGPTPSPQALQAVMAEMPGVRIETAEQVEVAFD